MNAAPAASTTSMSFIPTEEQEAIRRTAREFATEKLPVAHFRALRDSKDTTGFSRDAWRQLAELGLVGMALPEADGGGGMGFAELGAVIEELGRTLAPTPFFSTVVMSGSAIALGAADALRREWIQAISSGQRIVAFAHEERAHHAPWHIETRARRTERGWKLDGKKSFVVDGNVADAFVVVARATGATTDREGLGLFLVDAKSTGVTTTRLSTVDARNAARVSFEGVDAPHDAVLGEPGNVADHVERVLDRGRVALAAEMLGGALEAFERTVAYLKVRKQFGVPIGSFQALQHRAAWLFVELELLRAVVADALHALDHDSHHDSHHDISCDGNGRRDPAIVASGAKARANDTFLHVVNEAVQMHGGIGVTDELDIGLFLKRARVTELLLGDSAFHRDRFARLRGY